MRLDEFSDNKGVKTLYASRPLVNVDDVLAWARTQGFKSALNDGEFHVTIAFSKASVDWSKVEPLVNTITVEGGERSVIPLGDKGAVVLKFASEELQERWQDFRDQGASWDYPGYQPHVTITYDGKEMDLSKMEPYDGKLVFGPEAFEELNDTWSDDIKEQSLDEDAGVGVQAAPPAASAPAPPAASAPAAPAASAAPPTGLNPSMRKLIAEALQVVLWGLRSRFSIGGTIYFKDKLAYLDSIIKKLDLPAPNPPVNLRAPGGGGVMTRPVGGSTLVVDWTATRRAPVAGCVYADRKLTVRPNVLMDVASFPNKFMSERTIFQIVPTLYGAMEKAFSEAMQGFKQAVGAPDQVAMSGGSSGLKESFSLGDLDADAAYDIFSKSYDEATGVSWSKEKFLSRSRNWTFFGDNEGYVAVRKQRSGMRKLVGVAGNGRSILKGISELTADPGPLWGVISASLMPMACKRGLIAPHKYPGGPTLIRLILSTIPADILGSDTIDVQKDGGIKVGYADVGEHLKYFVANKEYFVEALKMQAVKEKLATMKGVGTLLRLMGIGT